jgi:Neutral/alkaline non-lysosomal ceramidase, N-terminal
MRLPVATCASSWSTGDGVNVSIYDFLLLRFRAFFCWIILLKSRLGVLLAFLLPHSDTSVSVASYLIGVGIGDVTGPIVETNSKLGSVAPVAYLTPVPLAVMGYADLNQTDTGLHMRQRSRAYIVADPSNPSNRIVFINSDIGMGDTGVRTQIVSQL